MCHEKNKGNFARENLITCKGCKKLFQRILGHLKQTRKTSKCEDAYSAEEQKIEEKSKRKRNKAKKTYKEKNPGKIAEQTKIYRKKILQDSSI